jgi:hypothetical protein
MDASKIIDEKLASLGDWRGEQLKLIRKTIRQVDPQIVEEWKWMGTPVWNHNGIVCIANAHKTVVKITFHKGAQLADPKRLFNNGLGGGKWRSIDLADGDKLDLEGFKGLVRAAIALNDEKPAGRKATAGAAGVTAKKKAKKAPAKQKPAAKKAPVAKPAPTAKKKLAKKK